MDRYQHMRIVRTCPKCHRRIKGIVYFWHIKRCAGYQFDLEELIAKAMEA
jgi:hypothetical protein